MRTPYCVLCEKHLTCARENSCHASELAPVKPFKDLARGIYVPQSLAGEFALLEASSVHYRPIAPKDANTLNVTIVFLSLTGNKPRMVFKGFAYYHADIGTVGKEFADVWLKKRILANPEDLNDRIGPVRVGIDSGRVYIIG